MILEGYVFPDKTEYSKLMDQALSISHRFQTEKQPFDESYNHNDLIQKYHTKMFIPKIVEALKKLSQEPQGDKEKGLVIADLGCGSGQVTRQILKACEKAEIKIQQIVGYDISEELIELANKDKKDEKIIYKKCNIQKHQAQADKYDAIIALHTLQWMNDLDRAVETAALQLKSKGLFFALTYIECKQFFQARLKYVQHSQWNKSFQPDQFQLYPFHFSPQIYLDSFSRYLHQLYSQTSKTQFQYTKQQLIRVFNSFFPEARHVQKQFKERKEKEEVAEKYLGEFVNQLQDVEGCVARKGNQYGYAPEMHYYIGFKKEKKELLA